MKRAFAIVAVLLFITGCMDNEENLKIGTQLLINSDFSRSSSSISPWSSFTPSGFITGVSKQTFRSGNQSVFIESKDLENTEAAVWSQSYTGQMPSIGARLRLRAFLKGVDITSNGLRSNVFVSVRAFPVEDSEGISSGRFFTTQNNVRVNGTFDWEPVELVIPFFPREVDRLEVYLVMSSQTSGKVYFDDVTLTVE